MEKQDCRDDTLAFYFYTCFKPFLERGSHHKTHPMLVGGGQFVVVQTADILHMNYLEDIVQS